MAEHKVTSSQFDRIRKERGVDTAVREALLGGASLELKGTRIRFSGGGSRLTGRKGFRKSRESSR